MNFKKYWKTAKNTGKVREICQSEKVGTMIVCMLNSWTDEFICSCRSKPAGRSKTTMEAGTAGYAQGLPRHCQRGSRGNCARILFN